ncbi:uncharacterized [Tachysurus ichikawai]
MTGASPAQLRVVKAELKADRRRGLSAIRHSVYVCMHVAWTEICAFHHILGLPLQAFSCKTHKSEGRRSPYWSGWQLKYRGSSKL